MILTKTGETQIWRGYRQNSEKKSNDSVENGEGPDLKTLYREPTRKSIAF